MSSSLHWTIQYTTLAGWQGSNPSQESHQQGELDYTGTNWIKLEQIGQYLIKYDYSGINWNILDQIELQLIKLDYTG